MEYKCFVCKTKDKKWYIQLGDDTSSRTELTSSFGSLCDVISNGDNSFYIKFSLENMSGAHVLHFLDIDETGGVYVFPMYLGMDNTLTVFTKDIFVKIFNQYPEKVYLLRHF